jgi:hypothetical protein
MAGPSLDRLRVEALGEPQRDSAMSEIVRGVGGNLGVPAGAVEMVSHLIIRKAWEDESIAVPLLERDEVGDLPQ